jgi:hypothetical protein
MEISRMTDQKKRFSRKITCENCGREAVHSRPGGRFCTAKCRLENWWKRRLGVATVVAVAAGLAVMASGCGGSEVSPLVGNYSGLLHWTRDGAPFWDQQAAVSVAQEGGGLRVTGNVRYKLDPAPLLTLTCQLDGSSCAAAGPAEDQWCGRYEVGAARLRRVGRAVLFEATTSSRCGVWHFAGELR